MEDAEVDSEDDDPPLKSKLEEKSLAELEEVEVRDEAVLLPEVVLPDEVTPLL